MGLKVKVDGDGSGFQATLDKLSEQAGDFGKKLNAKMSGNFSEAIMGIVPGLTGAIAGIFAVDSMKEYVASFLEEAHKISTGAIRLNVDTDTYQRLDNILDEVGLKADDAGASMDHVAQALQKIKQNPASEEARLLKQEFASLGVSLEDIKAGNYQEVFFKIWSNMKDIHPSGEQINAIKEVMGRSGTEMLPAMAVGMDSYLANANLIDKSKLEQMEAFREIRAEGEASWKAVGRKFAEYAGDVYTGLVALASPSAWSEVMKSSGDQQQEAWVKAQTAAIMEQVVALNKAKQSEQELADAKAAADAKWEKTDAEKAVNIQKEIDALRERNKIAGMNDDEKRAYFQKQLRDDQELWNAANDSGNWGSQTSRANLELHIEKVKAELLSLGKKEEKKTEHHANIERLGNASIGGIMLSHGGDDAKHQRGEMVKHLANIDKKTKQAKPGRANTDYH